MFKWAIYCLPGVAVNICCPWLFILFINDDLMTCHFNHMKIRPLDALCPLLVSPQSSACSSRGIWTMVLIPGTLTDLSPHMVRSPRPLQQILLLKSLSIWGFVFASWMCSTWTQGPTMRASVVDLILAANTSHIILYKENIEGETVTGRGTAASNKGTLSHAGAASHSGRAEQGGKRLEGVSPCFFPSVLLSEGNTTTMHNSSHIWPQVRQRGPLHP